MDKLNGKCNKFIKGEVYDSYEITQFIWDLRTSNINFLIHYKHKTKKSFTTDIITFPNVSGDVDINELIEKLNKIIEGNVSNK